MLVALGLGGGFCANDADGATTEDIKAEEASNLIRSLLGKCSGESGSPSCGGCSWEHRHITPRRTWLFAEIAWERGTWKAATESSSATVTQRARSGDWRVRAIDARIRTEVELFMRPPSPAQMKY
eukprot:3070836-Rhodomonas_salina.3